VFVNGKWGYINTKGEFVIKPQFDSASNFSEGLADVGIFNKKLNLIDKYGYINKKGEFVIKPQFSLAFGFSEDFAQVQTYSYDKDCYIDKLGKVVFCSSSPFSEDFHDGLAMFKTHGNMPDSKVGYIDKMGRVSIAPRFDGGSDFSEGLACVYSNEKAGFINRNGDIVIEQRFDGCLNFSEGLAAIQIGGKWGYIDRAGQIVIEPQYDDTKDFHEGVAIVEVGRKTTPLPAKEGEKVYSVQYGKFGVIDKKGQLIIPVKFTQISDFTSGLAVVNLTTDYVVCGGFDKWAYINRFGKFVWQSSQ